MINLLSVEEKKKIRSDYYLRVFSVCLPLFSGVLLFAILSLLPAYFYAQISNANMLKESRSAEVVNKKTQATEMGNVVADANKKIDLLAKPVSKTDAALVFDEILKKKPEGVTVIGYNYQKNVPGTKTNSSTNIIIRGVSSSREVIQSFVDTLKQNNDFASVDLPISSLVNGTNFPYGINISAKNLN